MGVTIPNVVIDLMILLLPLPMLWRLQIDVKKKAALIINFMLGYWSVIIFSCAINSPEGLTRSQCRHRNDFSTSVHHQGSTRRERRCDL